MDLGDIWHDLLYVKNLNNTLRKPTDVGMSNLFLIVKRDITIKSVMNTFTS